MTKNPNARAFIEFTEAHNISLYKIAKLARISDGTLRAFRDVPGRYLSTPIAVEVASVLSSLTGQEINVVKLFSSDEMRPAAFDEIVVSHVQNEKFLEILSNKNLEPEQLAQLAGVDEAAVYSIIQNNPIEKDEAIRIAEAIGVNAKDIGAQFIKQRRNFDDLPPMRLPANRQTIPSTENMSEKEVPHLPRDLPIRGTNKSEGLLLISSNPIGYTVRPPSLIGNSDAYALYVADNGMAPRMRAGELIYIDPHWPAQPLCDVIVNIKTGEHAGRTILACLSVRENMRATLTFYKDHDTLVFDENDIDIHKVLQGQELIVR